jgi:hypothetical protein
MNERRQNMKLHLNSWRSVLFLLFCSVCLTACQRKEVASIEDGKKLQEDCARLMTQYQAGEIPMKILPRSIKDLKPIRVTREENNIRILLEHERGKFTVGYDVFANLQLSPSTKGVWVQKTKFKGVYIFKMAY